MQKVHLHRSRPHLMLLEHAQAVVGVLCTKGYPPLTATKTYVRAFPLARCGYGVGMASELGDAQPRRINSPSKGASRTPWSAR